MRITFVRYTRNSIAILGLLAALSLSAQTPLIDQGRAAMNRGDTDAAVDLLEKAVAQSPRSAEAHFYLGSAYGAKAQSSGMFGAATYAGKVKDEFEQAVALNLKYVDARFGLVEFYAAAPGFMGGSFDKALDQARAIKTIDPIMGHRAYAFIYAAQKKSDLAKKEYLDAIREQPRSAKAHSFLGQYLANTEKNYGVAFAELETALKVDPSYMPPFYHLGRTASLANANLARGEEGLKKYLTYTPKENEPALANAHYFLGTIYEKEGKKAEAKQSYQAALKLNPSHKKAAEALKGLS
jgi:Tfp pilus assembly protein PilF